MVGFLVFMVAFVKDREFQSFFAKGCVLLHISMALWRVNFERRLEDLAWDWPRQAVGDVVLALSWATTFLALMLRRCWGDASDSDEEWVREGDWDGGGSSKNVLTDKVGTGSSPEDNNYRHQWQAGDDGKGRFQEKKDKIEMG
ncbi:hypothetical protein CCACVL1_30437 [Corchorus capsularis]|uniref:DUF7865 domain-containing protein n=1 Tax=Corchorus capsularis TaxID=210143 RepID=A0A1R3FX66_COCAP|nr:hypothetical protein CCACVL1_30437 [Corchorus capsularis]